MARSKALWRSVIVLYFIIGLEILIMISPAAGFFYAAFNPVLLSLAQRPATRWLTAFYLPHMVAPPDLMLAGVRLAGSVLFVVGGLVFLVCAGQVYFNKFTKKGVALRGLYNWIRHPQYLGLGLTGLGLSILWPRFLVVALWAVMVALYYLLARDEERRMLGQFGEDYGQYMDRTGMFVPKGLENAALKLIPLGSEAVRAAVVVATLAALSVGGAFAARAYTVRSLPLWSNGPVTALAILPNDLGLLDHRMAAVVSLPEIKARLDGQRGPFLVYVMPRNYVMQGMIADTGDEWQLYKRHHTVAMISDWILHPFGHLEGSSGMMHHAAAPGMGTESAGSGLVRRLIFLRVDTPNGEADPAALFGINASRAPIFMADVEIHGLTVQALRDLPQETGWGWVPTPSF
ncbi:MAG TPA: methyltransferase [Candidatus Methylomirabilis sp.]